MERLIEKVRRKTAHKRPIKGSLTTDMLKFIMSKDLAKVMILGIDLLHLIKEIHESEDPVENLMKFREAAMARLK